MEEEKEKETRWYSSLGGRKAMFIVLFLGFPEWLVLIWSFVIKNWDFAKFFSPIVLGGILAYLGVNLTQHIKKGNNND